MAFSRYQVMIAVHSRNIAPASMVEHSRRGRNLLAGARYMNTGRAQFRIGKSAAEFQSPASTTPDQLGLQQPHVLRLLQGTYGSAFSCAVRQ